MRTHTRRSWTQRSHRLDSKSLKYSAAFSYYNTDGFLENTYLDQKADPLKDYSGRLRMIWEPTDPFTGDLRLSADRLETRGFYFVIPRADESNPFSSFTTPPDANNTITPITNNNTGEDNRDLWGAALKLEFRNPSACCPRFRPGTRPRRSSPATPTTFAPFSSRSSTPSRAMT